MEAFVIIALIGVGLLAAELLLPTGGVLAALGVAGLVAGGIVALGSDSSAADSIGAGADHARRSSPAITFFFVTRKVDRGPPRPADADRDRGDDRRRAPRRARRSTPTGRSGCEGTLWAARLAAGAGPVRLGDRVTVEAVDGLTLGGAPAAADRAANERRSQLMAVVVGVIVVLAFFALIAVGLSVRVLREYERGVIFRLGRLIATKGPGLILLIPLIDRMVKVDLRTVTLNIPPQEVITRDNVPCRVNAVAYFRVVDQNRAVVEVENYLLATSQISQTALRSVLGKAELDQLLADRERLNEELQKIIDESTEPWGVKVTAVEIKDVEIPEQMQRAMARQAEAERERRAKIINSEGEFQAAQKLTDAADIISTNPASLQLRYLQTLLEIGCNQNTTVVFPLPMDVLEPFLGKGSAERAKADAAAAGTTPPRRRTTAGAAGRARPADDLPPSRS